MTKEQFTKRVIAAAVGSCVVDERAVEDAEGYDHELTLGRLRGMAEVLFSAESRGDTIGLLYECRDALALHDQHQALYERVWKWLQANAHAAEPNGYCLKRYSGTNPATPNCDCTGGVCRHRENRTAEPK